MRICFARRHEAGGGQSPPKRWFLAKHHPVLARPRPRSVVFYFLQ